MAQTFFPFDSGSGANITESQWGQMAQLWLSTGVVKGQLNSLNCYADSTGMQVKVDTGIAWIQGFYYKNDAVVTLPIATAPTSNSRIDRVVVQVDWTNNNIQLVVLQGTVAASPVEPALTQNSSLWQIPLASVAVGTNVSTIAAGNVTDERFPSPLITPTLLNGWTKNYQLYYWKDSTNTVFYSFSIQSGGTAPNTTFMIFPAGYRPSTTEMQMGFANGSPFICSIATSGYFQNLVTVPSTTNVVLTGSFKAMN